MLTGQAPGAGLNRSLCIGQVEKELNDAEICRSVCLTPDAIGSSWNVFEPLGHGPTRFGIARPGLADRSEGSGQ